MYEIDRRAQQIPFEELRLHFLYVATGSFISSMFLFYSPSAIPLSAFVARMDKYDLANAFAWNVEIAYVM